MDMIEENDYIDEDILFPEFYKIEANEDEIKDILLGREVIKD
jgi:hypothetical protein